MLVDLVKTTTPDGMRLDGALRRPDPGAAPSADVDACIYVHGVSGNFYSSALWERIAPAIVERGAAALAINTRGHDLAFSAEQAGRRRRQGAAYEIVDECRHDITAWIEFLVRQGYSRIALIGHSLGALKSIYSQARQPHEACRRIVAISPPRLSYGAYAEGPLSDSFRQAMAEAQRRVEAGQPNELQEIDFPFPLLIAAGAYVDKYGPAERYDLLSFACEAASPTLFIYGSIELKHGGPAFVGLPAALAGLSPWRHEPAFVEIAGANHFYAGVTEQLTATVVDWLSRK